MTLINSVRTFLEPRTRVIYLNSHNTVVYCEAAKTPFSKNKSPFLGDWLVSGILSSQSGTLLHPDSYIFFPINMNNIDPVLMFECLIYLNIYHYAMFATCETIMTTAKYVSIVNTPNIGRDAGVVFTKLTVELTKIIVFEKYRKKRRSMMFLIFVWSILVQSSVGSI